MGGEKDSVIWPECSTSLRTLCLKPYCSGSRFYYSCRSRNEMVKMGGLRKYMPFTHWTFLIACLAIAGIPPFSGFFSKDEILTAVFNFNPYFRSVDDFYSWSDCILYVPFVL